MNIKKYWNRIKRNWSWLSILNSPFKRPSLTFYFGKIDRGVPYFLPRKWVGLTWEEAKEEVVKQEMKTIEAYEKAGKSYRVPDRKQFGEKIKAKQRTRKSVPVKWQIKYIGLGWKTKFDSYRHEWDPMISITGFNRQFCVYFGLKDSMANMCYWEAWLYYRHETDENQTKKERVAQCREKYSVSWGTPKKGYTDYYEQILKKKYL